MADPAVKEKARELFVVNGFSMETILTMMDGEVSRKTLYNWRNADAWEEQRRDRCVKVANRRERLEAALDKLLDEFEVKTDPKLIFSIGKLVGALKSSSTFEFTEEKKEKAQAARKGFTKENLENLEKELNVL